MNTFSLQVDALFDAICALKWLILKERIAIWLFPHIGSESCPNRLPPKVMYLILFYHFWETFIRGADFDIFVDLIDFDDNVDQIH